MKSTQVGIDLDRLTAFGTSRKQPQKVDVNTKPVFDAYRAVRQLERLFPRAGVSGKPSPVKGWDP
jgi:hypothetical protein